MAALTEVMDMVRSKLGVPDLDPFQLQQFCRWGRRELEVRGNYYYALGSTPKDFTCTAGTQTHAILTSGGVALNLPNFKSAHSMFIRGITTAQDWITLPVGSWEGSVDHANTTQGKPQMALINGNTLYFFPVPDAAYNVRLIYFDWTTNPADITVTTDELINNWDQALFWASVMVGKRFLENSQAAGDAFERLVDEQVEKLKAFTNERLKDPVNTMSTREAAMILQASGAQPQ